MDRASGYERRFRTSSLESEVLASVACDLSPSQIDRILSKSGISNLSSELAGQPSTVVEDAGSESAGTTRTELTAAATPQTSIELRNRLPPVLSHRRRSWRCWGSLAMANVILLIAGAAAGWCYLNDQLDRRVVVLEQIIHHSSTTPQLSETVERQSAQRPGNRGSEAIAAPTRPLDLVAGDPLDLDTVVPVSTWPPAQITYSPFPSDFLEDEHIVDRVDRAVVLVKVMNEKNRVISTGSGFVVGSESLVATNYHVLSQGTSAAVQFRDQSEYRIDGTRAADPEGDLVLLEIADPPQDIESFDLAAADTTLRRGESVIAAGRPRRLGFTMTKGIVSAVHITEKLPPLYRSSIDAPAGFLLVQTTVGAILDGSSGGPLLNEKAEVVGINTWVPPNGTGAFAIHVRHLMHLIDQMSAETVALEETTRPNREFAALNQEYKARKADHIPDDSISSAPELSYGARLIELAKKYPDHPVAWNALSRAVRILSQSEDERAEPALRAAAEEIRANYAGSWKFELLLRTIERL